MLVSLWALLYAMTATCLVVTQTVSNIGSMITQAPSAKEFELRKRYYYYVYYHVDYVEVTTCGVIPNSIASANGLYGTGSAVAAITTPFPVVCEGLCANAGNYLGCIDRSTASVATTCTDYASSATACKADKACYWDLTCESAAPYCNQNIYQGSITQFVCGIKKYAPITVTSQVNMTQYIAATPNITTTSSSSATAVSNSQDDVDRISEALQKIGLSVGALAGLCVAAVLVLCCGCCGICYWRSKRGSKRRYGQGPYMHQTTAYQPAVQSQQPLVDQYYHQYRPGPEQQRYEQYRHQ